ncbi:MAG: cation:proton antiporter, partial [Gammaproteobacteria bacterium]|nr:cation:proton antiporter [Gammaproteobacteria bacterium]
MPLSEVLLISMGLLTIAIVAAGLFRDFSIPYTVLLVVIGLGLSELTKTWHWLMPLQEFRLTPDLVFFVFLPALIFESGLSLDARQLIKDLAPVLTLAIPALLISTFLVGVGVWLLVDINFIIALLFGALISATDPVAVVTLFKELGAPLRLNVLVEGESLFNDATAIVVFGFLLAMVVDGTHFSLVNSGAALLEFFRVFIGGVLVGVVIGLLVSEILFRLQCQVSAVITMSLVAAYGSFIISEYLLHVSGVMATVFAAIVLNVYGLTRISGDVKPILNETWEFVGLVANSFLFLLVGLSIDASSLITSSGLILVVVCIVLLARAATVYTLLPITTRLFKLP